MRTIRTSFWMGFDAALMLTYLGGMYQLKGVQSTTMWACMKVVKCGGRRGKIKACIRETYFAWKWTDSCEIPMLGTVPCSTQRDRHLHPYLLYVCLSAPLRVNVACLCAPLRNHLDQAGKEQRRRQPSIGAHGRLAAGKE